MIFFGAFLLLFFVFRLWLAGFGGIHPDEAYYWFWSRHLDFGYFDHPPMIAWFIRLGDFVVKHLVPKAALDAYPVFFAQVGFRIVPYFATCVLVPMGVARCIEIMQKRPLGITQMIALLSAPVFLFGPQIVTPDAPFFLGWTLCLFFNLLILEERGLEAVPGDATPFRPALAIAAGVSLAFAAYSKVTAIVAAFLFAICGVGPFNALLAGFTALLLMLPHAAWYRSVGIPQQAGILFQFSNALRGEQVAVSYRRVGDLIATQILFWGPITFFSVFALTIADIKRFFLPRKLRRPTGTLFLWALAPIVFFSLTALRRPAEANWPLIGAVAGIVLVLSKSFDNRRAVVAVALSNIFVCVIAVMALFRPLALADIVRPFLPHLSKQLERPSRTREFTDWDRFHTLVFEATRINSYPIWIENYQILSGLLFYDSAIPQEPMADRFRVWPEASRRSEFTLHAQFTPASLTEPHWIVAAGHVGPPTGCHLSQTLFKNVADDQPFNIIRCGF